MSGAGAIERSSLPDLMRQGVVMGDGGYLVELERRGLVGGEGLYIPTVALDAPDALRNLHEEFLGAGADVLQAMTFWTTSDKLAARGWGREHVEALNRAAVCVAREAAAGRALVAGTITHTFLYWAHDTSKVSQVRAILREQVGMLAAAGVDFLVLETFFSIAEMRIALEEARTVGLPIIATMSFRPYWDRTEDEVPVREIAKILAGEGACAVGINCEQDPDTVLPILRALAEGAPRGLPLVAQPIAFRVTPEHPYYSGLPEFHGEPGLETVQVPRAVFTRFAKEAVELGVRYLGGCCGCNAAYLRALASGVPASMRVTTPPAAKGVS